jgi:hypothetical protein
MVSISDVVYLVDVPANGVNDLLRRGFIKVNNPNGEDLMYHPKHWKVCQSGERFGYECEKVYFQPLTQSAKDFCQTVVDDIVP